MDNFKLDTSNMDEAASLCAKLAEKMRDLKQEMDNVETVLVNSWSGKGGTSFRKKYYVLTQQLNDLTDDLFQMSEAIYDAEECYIQADVDGAKLLDGVQKPGEGSAMVLPENYSRSGMDKTNSVSSNGDGIRSGNGGSGAKGASGGGGGFR